MKEQIDYSGIYKYNGNDSKLTEIVEIIKQSAKCGLLDSSTKEIITNSKNDISYDYIYNFKDINRNFKIEVEIPKKLYDVNNLNMYYLEKYINQHKKQLDNLKKNINIHYVNKKALVAIGTACVIVTGCFLAKTNAITEVVDKYIEWDNANFDSKVDSWQPYIDKVNENIYHNEYYENLNKIKSEEKNYDIEDELETILKTK